MTILFAFISISRAHNAFVEQVAVVAHFSRGGRSLQVGVTLSWSSLPLLRTPDQVHLAILPSGGLCSFTTSRRRFGALRGNAEREAARATTTDRTLRTGWELGSVGPLAASSYIVQAEPFPAHSRSLRSSFSSDHPVACKLSLARLHRD